MPLTGTADARPPVRGTTVDCRPVVLVVPPFQTLTRPALGVSQLKSALEARGHRTIVVYLNFRFAERIGIHLYEWISENAMSILLGEMIFSQVLFERDAADIDRYVEDVLHRSRAGKHLSQVLSGREPNQALRELAGAAADFCAGEGLQAILASSPWMVGFTSSFQQNCSSLAMTRALKSSRSDILTIMGGANCESEMGQELFTRFPELDFVGQGECDQSLVALVDALRRGSDGSDIAGMLTRTSSSARGPEPISADQLDRLPHPDFDDFFEQLAASQIAARVRPALVMETSRGCWWGAKKHCTFCGLNGQGMAFRSKSPSRALNEMRSLVDRYAVPRIQVVDNILDMGYFKTLLPALADEPVGDLFYETKSNLTREQVELLARAGVRWIQPGIESLSDRTLQLMRKGTTELQNVQLLKWCTERGIRVAWNFLFGFPGEDEGELAQIARDAEALHHLEPPSGAAVLHLDRFSPYFEAPEQWGLTSIRPAPPYYHVYPLPDESVRKIAYVYYCEAFGDKAKSAAFQQLQQVVRRWQTATARAHLLALPRRTGLILLDGRSCATRRVHRLTGLTRRLYEYCDHVRTARDIARAFAADASADELSSQLERLVEQRVLLNAGQRYLSLATYPLPDYKRYVPFPGGEVTHANGEQARSASRTTSRLRPAAVAAEVRLGLTAARHRLEHHAFRAMMSAARALCEGALPPPAEPGSGAQLPVLAGDPR